MQDIEHNMDDLLRRAAENYPLKTGEGDWDAVAMQLNAPVVPVRKKNNNRKWAISIMLLFLCMSSFLYTADTFVKHQAAGIKKSSSTAINASSNAINNEVSHQNHKPVAITNSKPPKTDTKMGDDINTHNPQPAAVNISNAVNNADDIPVIHHQPPQLNNLISNQPPIPPTAHSPTRKRGLYVGLLAGPEFNQVKNQGLERSGFDIGAIAGYQFNKKFSVETGLFFSKKYYFTDGKHFNMEMPGMKVLSLEGSCAVLEIPLKAKYTVFDKRKTSIFSSAGISSYLVMKEKNNYLTLTNGTQQNMVASYKETCRYFAATIDVSVGYEHRLGTRTNLRIEPYLQLPLQGIGVGTLPVKSAGVHIGLTRSFH